MQQVRWFDRKFDFSDQQNVFPGLVERLDGTYVRIQSKLKTIPQDRLGIRLDDTWSIKENIGHLTDLEPLWLGRLEDFLSAKEMLRSADLENKKTDEADHNNKTGAELLADFLTERNKLMTLLKELSEEQIYCSALHPRLMKPMRLMDMLKFVAEHDDHHLATMTAIAKRLNS